MFPDEVVSVNSVSRFKRHLDGFLCDQDLYYNYTADMQHRKSQCSSNIGEVVVVIHVYNGYDGLK